jgi:hypothetical protein
VVPYPLGCLPAGSNPEKKGGGTAN